MKYFFRIVSLLFSFIVPILFISTAWNEQGYIKLAIWSIVLISNAFVLKEIISELSKDDEEDPIEFMKRKL